MVPETVTQVDDMLIPRSNSALFHKLLSAPERVSGTDRGGPPRLVQKIERYFIKIKILKMRLRRPYVTCAKPNRQSEFNDKNENVGKETG